VTPAFLLKKLVSLFLMPFSIGIILLGLGYMKMKRGRSGASKALVLAGILWLILFSYDPLANLMLYPLEQRYPAMLKPPQSIRYIYVLGGGHHTDRSLPITSQIDSESIVRLAEGVRLYRLLKGRAKLIVSGYSGLHDPSSHAHMEQTLAIALGIPSDAIILVPKATDTEDEAIAAKNITRETPLALVTSAHHMLRAMHWFEKEGLHPYPAPTYHLATLQHPHYLSFFSPSALHKSTIFFHEAIGMLWQKIKNFVK